MAVILLFLVTQIVTVLGIACPEGQIKHKECCVPVFSCGEGHHIEKCDRDGNEDKCTKCPSGSLNHFNSSSFDIKTCYSRVCKLSDSMAISKNACACDLTKGWYGENHRACQVKYGGCPVGQELTQKGRCERCINFHYKDWHGYGFCKRHSDCSRLNMDEIKGNSTHANKCIEKGKPLKTTATTTPTTTPTTTKLTTQSTSTTTSTTTKATTTKEAVTTTIKAARELPAVLLDRTQSPTKVSRNLPVVGNRGPSDEEVRSGRLEGILIAVVAILCCLLLVIICVGTIAYLRRRLKPAPDVTIPNRPALPLPVPQNDHQSEAFAPSTYQSERQSQPLLPPENPYLSMSSPNHPCIYALPASMHLNNSYSINYPQGRSPMFDNASANGLQYIPPQNRQMSTGSPNNLGSQVTLQTRNEHLYMTLPAERCDALVPCENSLVSMEPETQLKRPCYFFDPQPMSNIHSHISRCSFHMRDDQTNVYADINI